MPEFDMALFSKPGQFTSYGTALEKAAAEIQAVCEQFITITTEVGFTWTGEASGAHKKAVNLKVKEFEKVCQALTSGGAALDAGGVQLEAMVDALKAEVNTARGAGFAVLPGGIVTPGPAQIAEASAAGPAGPEILAAYEAAAAAWTTFFESSIAAITASDVALEARLQTVNAEISTIRPPMGANARPSVADDPYQRPGFRDGLRDEVWDRAVADSHARGDGGVVRDPLTGKPMNRNDPWDMGHKPGYEFRKHRAQAEIHQPTRQRYVDEYNQADHYRPEIPKSNQSHADEAGDDVDHWADYYRNNPVTQRRR